MAAIINWYGITDLNDMLAGQGARSYALQWLGSSANRETLAKSVSPMTYVRSDLRPILSIQGDADPIVPYSQNVRLRDALTKAGTSVERQARVRAQARAFPYSASRRLHAFSACGSL